MVRVIRNRSKRAGCGCHSMAGDPPASWKGDPYALWGTVSKLAGADWAAKLGIPILEHGAAIIGKWAYYLQHGNFPDTSAGRQAAAPVIANDLFKSIGIRYSETSVYNLLQTADAYLRKDAKLPTAQQGKQSLTLSRAASTVKKSFTAAAAEAGNRWGDQKTEYKKNLGWITSPWAWGGGLVALALGGAVLSGVTSGVKRRIGG
jgi:hypothetical protein